MRLSFHGAARTVTGSKHLLTLENGNKVLLDCGLFQGGSEMERLNLDFGFSAQDINAVILSHAHIDHSGLLPKLVKEGFRGSIFCSQPTAELAGILLLDSARIHENDVRFLNKMRQKKNQSLLKELFREEDVIETIKLFHPVPMQTDFDVIEDVKCFFSDAGHIIGSCAMHLSCNENGKVHRISFSGDVGRYSNPILKAPEDFPQAEYIICESTYGDSLHEESGLNESVFEDVIIDTCVKKRGKVIIPAFSVGRTQELIYSLNKMYERGKLPPIKVFVDSPLSMEATEIVAQHKDWYNSKVQDFMKTDYNPFDFPGLQYIAEKRDSQSLNQYSEPCIIISASGMAEFGRIKHHIAHNVENPNNTILIVGYCEPNSLGARLLANSDSVRIFGNQYQKNAAVKQIKSFSAHADYQDLLRYLSCQDPSEVQSIFLVHGEYDVQLHFKEKLLSMGFQSVLIPELHESYTLAQNL